MPSPSPAPVATIRVPVIVSGLALFASLAWLLSRIRYGIDFEDEMQYYGEIASLTRTGRFFENDLFLQQLGYFFLLPFFKLHAWLFPDLSYLVLFGRLLLFAAYAGTGVLLWRALSRAGSFSYAEKLGGLAVFFAWVPFQLFAFSYNTTAYLLNILLLCTWLVRDPARPGRYLLTVAGLLTLLTYTHPAAGLALLVLAAAETGTNLGWPQALRLILATAAAGLATLAGLIAMHGRDFGEDVLAALRLSQAFGAGENIFKADQFPSWVTIIGVSSLFLWRQRLGPIFTWPFSAARPPAIRWLCLAGIGLGNYHLLALTMSWQQSFLPACLLLGVLLVLAAGLPPSEQNGGLAWQRRAMFAVLAASLGALATILVHHSDLIGSSSTGIFALGVYGALLVLLTAAGDSVPAGPAAAGLVSGAVVAYSSSNGVSSFGIGAAGALPFLAVYAMRGLRRAGRPGATGLAPLIALLLLTNGLLVPYGEQFAWRPFLPFHGVPAFQGLWSSPEKIEAVERFLPVAARVRAQRITIIGPHPWLYFVFGGQPVTSLLFMKFDGKPPAYDLTAARLFRAGQPDVLVLTTLSMPRSFGGVVQSWARTDDLVTAVPIPLGFNKRLRSQIGYGFSSNVIILTRKGDAP